MPEPTTDPADDLPEAERHPVIMIYLTVKLDGSRGWTNALRVQTPDGATCLSSWGRSGGALHIGEGKTIGDLQTAWLMAIEALESFQ